MPHIFNDIVDCKHNQLYIQLVLTLLLSLNLSGTIARNEAPSSLTEMVQWDRSFIGGVWKITLAFIEVPPQLQISSNSQMFGSKVSTAWRSMVDCVCRALSKGLLRELCAIQPTAATLTPARLQTLNCVRRSTIPNALQGTANWMSKELLCFTSYLSYTIC